MSFSLVGGSDGPTTFFFAGSLGDVIWIPVALAALIIGGICVGKIISRRKNQK